MDEISKLMKFRDPKTGDVFEDIFNAAEHYCENCREQLCGSCFNNPRCKLSNQWLEAYPTEAARLMGFEVVEDKEERMEKKEMSRICEVLGVEVGQRFTVDGYCPTVKAFWITEDGLFETDPPKFPGTSCAMMQAINHPDRIIRKPRFTQEEVAVLRYIDEAQKIKEVHRNECGTLEILFETEGRWAFPADMFPSLRPRQAVKLSDITGECP